MDYKIEKFSKIIEEQNVTISNYKAKLKDLVLAYKSLTQEKSALEASISALKSIHPSSNDATLHANEDTKNDGTSQFVENVENIPEKENEDSPPTTSQSADAKDTKAQIDVLVSSLLTVTQQKDRLETSCTAERKQFRMELNEKSIEIENLKQKISTLEAENKEWRTKLRSQQLEHDKQQNDCSLMLKELQSMLNSERIVNDQLHSQIEDLKVEVEEKKKATSFHIANLTNNELTLKDELDKANENLKTALHKLSQPIPQIAMLEKQIKEAKEVEEKLRGVEGKTLEEAEMKIAEISNVTEARICALEEKILELSEMLGNAEKSKLADQTSILKLKERNIQLDQENKTLLVLTEKNNSLEEMSPQEILTKIRAVIPRLLSSGHDISPLYEELNCEDLHKSCKMQLEQVQEEFGRYKLRAQSVLKTKAKDPVNDSVVGQLKRQISELKETVVQLKNDIHAKEIELRSKDESHAKIMSCLGEKQKSEINQLNSEWQHKLADLENEMRKQRERTVSMLAEKEQEISELKYYSPILGHRSEIEKSSPKPEMGFPHVPMFRSTPIVPDENGIGASSGSMEEGGDMENHDHNVAINHLFSRRNDNSLLGKEAGNLLHYVQEKARLELELALMRKQKNSAESTLREMQYLLVLKDDEHSTEVKALRESIEKVERDIGRESANLEYLKNVVYQYILCKETSSRLQMFNAISTILQFSPQEKQIVLTKKGWKL